MKVFLGLTEVAGYYSNLKKGFWELGIDCTFISLTENRFDYGGDDTFWLVKLIRDLKKRRSAIKRTQLLIKMFYVFSHELSMITLFLWALYRFDVFIFGFNSTFFRYLDLPVLKLFRKKIIYMYHGSDSRPPFLSGVHISEEMNKTIEECITLTKKMKQQILIIEKYADYIINYPPQAYFHEKPFILGLIIGLPFDNSSIIDEEIVMDNSRSGYVNIVHAPSRPITKGTPRIRKIINDLKRKGYFINYIELINLPNKKVLEELLSCDFALTQMYSDTPMPGIVTEAAYFGKPSVIGGYYSTYIENDVPGEYIPPSEYCHPDEVQNAVEKLIVVEEYRLEMGRKAQKFVKNKWAPKEVAKRYLRIINDDIPVDWYYDPKNISYPYGGGLPTERLKTVIKQIVERKGPEALQLNDKPDLLEKLLQIIK